MKPMQYFDEEYLAQCRQMTSEQIIQFLDDFRQLHGASTSGQWKLISIKIPENLLNTSGHKQSGVSFPVKAAGNKQSFLAC